MTEEEGRRVTDTPLLDTSRILAILYTLGFFAIVFVMMLRGIPQENADAINQLLGALTIIQTTIVAFFFGGSKGAETMQKQLTVSKDKADSTVQDIAKSAPAVAAAVVAAQVPTNGHPIKAADVKEEAQGDVTVTGDK